MATCTRIVWKGCQRLLLSPAHTSPAPRSLPVRTFGAVKAQKKEKKEEEVKKKPVKERRLVEDRRRPPLDDVYVMRHYPRTLSGAAETIEQLKTFQQLDFTPTDQPVHMELRLNMSGEKKKRVDPFISTVLLPHRFRKDLNRVLVFTEDPDQVRLALQNGAAAAGGVELIQPILDENVSADFYVAVPEIIPKLVALKNKLRKQFPKSKRGSVGPHISLMLERFKVAHQFMVEDECYVKTQIGTLDMPTHQLVANVQTVVTDVCSHQPAQTNTGPFVERAILFSKTSEAVWFKIEDLLEKEEEEEAAL